MSEKRLLKQVDTPYAAALLGIVGYQHFDDTKALREKIIHYFCQNRRNRTGYKHTRGVSRSRDARKLLVENDVNKHATIFMLRFNAEIVFQFVKMLYCKNTAYRQL